jgi:hypothetical protein
MAQKQETMQAEDGTMDTTPAHSYSGTPFWDGMGDGETLPFFGPGEALKRKGLVVQFLTDKPRRETINTFDETKTDCWFDIIYFRSSDGGKSTQPVKMTWTICQISLLTELKNYAPLKNKIFQIKLEKVDEAWKKAHPKYKGKERYSVTFIEEKDPPAVTYPADPDTGDVEVETVN